MPQSQPESQPSPSRPAKLNLANLERVNGPPLLSPNSHHSGPRSCSPFREGAPRIHTGSSPSAARRGSLADSLRGVHPSPRQRNPSFGQQALQDLINNPPVARPQQPNHNYQDRDWRTITVGEIIDPKEVRFVESDSSVETATKLLIESGAPNVVLVRQDRSTRQAIGSFDYDDLNAYLLLVTNLAYPASADASQIKNVLERASKHEPTPLTDVQYLLGRKEPPAFLHDTDTLVKAVEILGGGVHRIIVRKHASTEVVGILSQLRLVRFFWENMASFRQVFSLQHSTIKELDLGTHTVISINGDRPLKEALLLMHTEGVTSLSVLDNHNNVIGNISHVDVRLLTDTSALPLLDSSCIHFISVILSDRGMHQGKDSYPVFHVTPHSTLAHTVAKLVATRSHRMWIVDAPSPTSSVPESPVTTGQNITSPPSALHQHSSHSLSGPPYTQITPNMAISASALPGAVLSGRLCGVVSLTDVLNLFARVSGLSPQDPEETRRRRRRDSSSSSGSVRRSADGVRGSFDLSSSSSQRR